MMFPRLKQLVVAQIVAVPARVVVSRFIDRLPAPLAQGFVSALKYWAGADPFDPPIEFPPPEFGGPILTFTSWSEVSQMCGDSRVWAGLHFEVNTTLKRSGVLVFIDVFMLSPPFSAATGSWCGCYCGRCRCYRCCLQSSFFGGGVVVSKVTVHDKKFQSHRRESKSE